jgi:protein phosphatase
MLVLGGRTNTVGENV